jgi:small-conductance mechanosensitive channel
MPLDTFSIAGNTLEQWTVALVAFAVSFLLIRILLSIVVRNAKRAAERIATKADDLAAKTLERWSTLMTLIVATAIAIQFIGLTQTGRAVVHGAVFVLGAVISIVSLEHVTLHVFRRFVFTRNEEAKQFADIGSLCIRIAFWVVGVLLILSNLGINVVSIVAGLGIGGIAVALAVQNILGDIFSAFSLYLDRPFRLGDFIVAGPHMGTVRKIGIKSTRIQALQGEEIVIPNRELTETRVQNFKRMHRRRVQFTFAVAYSTPPEHLEEIADFVRELIRTQEKTSLERAHFKEFGDAGFVFEVAYVIEDADHTVYMDIQQDLNVAILRWLRDHGIAIGRQAAILQMAPADTPSRS